jgi:hypothetical protein
MFELQGHTLHRVAQEAGVPVSTVRNFLLHRLISGWAHYRIQQALSYLGRRH